MENNTSFYQVIKLDSEQIPQKQTKKQYEELSRNFQPTLVHDSTLWTEKFKYVTNPSHLDRDAIRNLRIMVITQTFHVKLQILQLF